MAFPARPGPAPVVGLERHARRRRRVHDPRGRSQHAARQVLNGYTGIVIADGYGAYDALARAGPGFILAHCWAHVRRKFVEAERMILRRAGRS